MSISLVAAACVASAHAFGPANGLTRRAVIALPLAATPLAARAAGKLVGDDRFALSLPAGFVASKRSATQGTLYVAGNFPRAAVVSVTAWPIGDLLASDAAGLSLPGMPAAKPRAAPRSPSSLSDIAPSDELAKILVRQRDREQGGGLVSSLLSSSEDGGRLVLELLTELPVRARQFAFWTETPLHAHTRPTLHHGSTPGVQKPSLSRKERYRSLLVGLHGP